jgi:hypothetical protein
VLHDLNLAALCDRVMAGVQRAGLDADDVLLERSLLVRTDANEAQWVTVDYLSDRALFEADFRRKNSRGALESKQLSDVVMLAARVTATVEESS